jgi:hypothetical protein
MHASSSFPSENDAFTLTSTHTCTLLSAWEKILVLSTIDVLRFRQFSLNIWWLYSSTYNLLTDFRTGFILLVLVFLHLLIFP